MASKPLGLWDIADMVKKIYGAHAPTDGLCLWCDAVTMFQINADAVQNGLTVVPAARYCSAAEPERSGSRLSACPR